MEKPLYEFFFKDGKFHFTTAIVKNPAVEDTLAYFKEEQETPTFFANEEKRMIYSVAMIPNKIIPRKAKGDRPDCLGFFSAETIEKFQENYAKFNGNEKVNIDHTENKADGVYCVESWIVNNPEIDKTKTLGLNTIKGSLVQGFKVENDEVWNQCKNGNLDGLSIEAYLDHKEVSNFKTEIEMSTEKNKDNLWKTLTDFFSSDSAAAVEETDEEKAARLEAEKMAEDTPPVADDTPDLAAENEMLKAKVADLESKLATMEADKVKEETALETMKKEVAEVKSEFAKFKSETPAATPIVNAPPVTEHPNEALAKFRAQKNN